MNLQFFTLSEAERDVYLQQAALQNNLSSIIVEKDFWVCWLLGILFESSFSSSLVFKGGTSLSKVFGVIDRFSEDLDLSLSPEFLNLADAGNSHNQANKWMTRAEEACTEKIRTSIITELDGIVASVLGVRSSGWFEFLLDGATKSPVLLFHYPSSQPPGFDYLKRSVKLEFGSLTDQQPKGRYPVRPWVADIFPAAFSDWACEVVALEIERTFWEKATILHAECHRPDDRPTPDRFSRHYGDMAALASTSESAINSHELRDRVVDWKSRFFRSSWARYDLAKPGTFRLVPPPDRQSALRRDYEAMRAMYLSEPCSFDDILRALAYLEKKINGGASATRNQNA